MSEHTVLRLWPGFSQVAPFFIYACLNISNITLHQPATVRGHPLSISNLLSCRCILSLLTSAKCIDLYLFGCNTDCVPRYRLIYKKITSKTDQGFGKWTNNDSWWDTRGPEQAQLAVHKLILWNLTWPDLTWYSKARIEICVATQNFPPFFSPGAGSRNCKLRFALNTNANTIHSLKHCTTGKPSPFFFTKQLKT